MLRLSCLHQAYIMKGLVSQWTDQSLAKIITMVVQRQSQHVKHVVIEGEY
jgi:hypothetical protein